ncbi:MAG: universal stress protein [Gammaproteobacteria bacterium]|nr:universal stress protein [Gammaproteobacteria bacterium]
MSYRHVLIAVDFSSASEHVARRAIGISRRNSAVLSLLHVVDYLPPLGFADDLLPTPALLVNEKELIGHGMASLETFARKIDLPADTARHVRLGAPHQEIVEFARTQGVDLIVLGSHGRHGLGRLLGSTANSVLNHAACDVLAVRITA